MFPLLRTLLALPCLGFALLAAAPVLRAEGLIEQPTPFSVWLDFQALSRPGSPKPALPIWLESVVRETIPAAKERPKKTAFRLRIRRLPALTNELSLRLFFTDVPGAGLLVSGWTETGRQPFDTRPLGEGINLATSETLLIPAGDLDYIDIEVNGDGSNIRGAFLATMQKHEVRHALDFAASTSVDDPFRRTPEPTPLHGDSFLFGRVRATLDSSVVKLEPPNVAQASYEFELDAGPLLAVCSFEILNADPNDPLYVWINGRRVGPVSVQFPDLADPGFHGTARPLDEGLSFRYAGWLRGQVILRGPHLTGGLNKIVFGLSEDSTPVALRDVEIQLKYPWKHLDYELAP